MWLAKPPPGSWGVGGGEASGLAALGRAGADKGWLTCTLPPVPNLGSL